MTYPDDGPKRGDHRHDVEGLDDALLDEGQRVPVRFENVHLESVGADRVLKEGAVSPREDRTYR